MSVSSLAGYDWHLHIYCNVMQTSYTSAPWLFGFLVKDVDHNTADQVLASNPLYF